MDYLFRPQTQGAIHKIVVYDMGRPTAEYCMETVGALSEAGQRLLNTTLTAWGLLDFCLSPGNRVDFPLTEPERRYIQDTYRYCTKLYAENYGLAVAPLEFAPEKTAPEYPLQTMTEQFFLGYTGGKDSTLCKLLLQELGKEIVYYSVSYDDDATRGYGRIFNRILDPELYNRHTITGYKANSDYIAFQQADDIHVTFIAPYLYPRSSYPGNLAVGLPYDAVHTFASGVPDLVPTETLQSVEYLESLMHSYGFSAYRVVSPVASLHTFGIYRLLSSLIGMEGLMALDSCWEQTEQHPEPCGMCPKCQRLKYVFKHCFCLDYLPQTPLLHITGGDFLFGSIHASQLLERFSAEDVSTHQFLCEGARVEWEFVRHIQQRHGFEPIRLPNIPFVKDTQTWTQVLSQIVQTTGVDYRLLPDTPDPALPEDAPYLPFEKYYNWGRKYPVARCCRDWEQALQEASHGQQ